MKPQSTPQDRRGATNLCGPAAHSALASFYLRIERSRVVRGLAVLCECKVIYVKLNNYLIAPLERFNEDEQTPLYTFIKVCRTIGAIFDLNCLHLQ
jgi:hypothetical protein